MTQSNNYTPKERLIIEMKFLLRTKDGKYLKTYFKASSVLTEDVKLAMRFSTRSEARRMGMTALNGEFEVEQMQ